jgi:hypothetical protein
MVTHVPAELHFSIIGADEDRRKPSLVEAAVEKRNILVFQVIYYKAPQGISIVRRDTSNQVIDHGTVCNKLVYHNTNLDMYIS